jgi:hypothetical protein
MMDAFDHPAFTASRQSSQISVESPSILNDIPTAIEESKPAHLTVEYGFTYTA